MKHQNTHTSWYAIISAVLIIGFLLILTVWWFQLVLQEVYDGRGKQNYLKAYAAAEAGLELALYEVQEKWYGYYEKKWFSSDIFWDSPRNAQFSYEFSWKVSEHSWSLQTSQIDIIPLFWIDTDGEVYNISWWLELSTDSDSRLAWNIVWEDVWVWGNWQFDSGTKQVDRKWLEDAWNFILTNSLLDDFIATPWEKYLFIMNTAETQSWEAIEYTLTSSWNNQYFTLPRQDIISSGRIGNFTQNIRIDLDNTEYLWLLRYSIFAWD